MADLAAEFQQAVVEVLCAKALAALKKVGLKTLVVAGVVGANRRLRERLDRDMAKVGGRVFYPPLGLCTDNGAMIAFAGALRLFRVVDAFVGTIAVVALVGTVLVVTNTLLMAVAERTREIGILMAVGWTPWLVLRMLLAESVLLCLAGAALGNVAGLALLNTVNGMETVGFGCDSCLALAFAGGHVVCSHARHRPARAGLARRRAVAHAAAGRPAP